MKLPEIKAILTYVSEVKKVNDSLSKTTVVFKIPERKISNEWGEEKVIKEEVYEADILNNKVRHEDLIAWSNQKVIIQAYLNGFQYEKEETKQIVYGKSITIQEMKKA